MARIEETYGVFDSHYLTDKELAVLLTSCGYALKDAKKLLSPSKGYVVVNFMGKGLPALLKACETGLQMFDDDTMKITHYRGPTEFHNPDDLIDVIDKIEVSIDFEKWCNNLVNFGYGTNPKDLEGWFIKLSHIFETQDISDVVEGRKLRHEDEITYPVDNLL